MSGAKIVMRPSTTSRKPIPMPMAMAALRVSTASMRPISPQTAPAPGRPSSVSRRRKRRFAADRRERTRRPYGLEPLPLSNREQSVCCRRLPVVVDVHDSGSELLDDRHRLVVSHLDDHFAFESRSRRPRKLVSVLEPGASVPDVLVWISPREEARSLREVLGAGLSLLCFYLYDWSTT